MKSNRCVQLSSFISMFLAREYWGSKRLPSFHPVSVPFSPSWQCFRWYEILNNSVRILSVLQGFTTLDKKLFHRDFLENLFSVFLLLLRWLRGSLIFLKSFCVTYILTFQTFWGITMVVQTHPQVFCFVFSRTCFPDSKFIIFSYIGWLTIYPNHPTLDSWCLTVLAIYVSPFEFHDKLQEKNQVTPRTPLGNLLSYRTNITT